MLLENLLAFFLVLVFLFPLLNKVVRLANRAWNEREFLEEKQFRQVVIITPLITVLIFIVFYFGVLALISLIEI